MPHNRNQMPPAIAVHHATELPSPSERVAQALEVLCNLGVPELTDALWSRVTGEDTWERLPHLSLSESPTRIFIDVVRYGNRPDLSDRLRLACTDLLEREWRPSGLQRGNTIAVAGPREIGRAHV